MPEQQVILTRPSGDAAHWQRGLREAGLCALRLPLIEVTALVSSAELAQAWQQLPRYQAVMFVSGNAVRYFFEVKPALAHVFQAQSAIKTRAWATGPGTVAALQRAGVAPECIDAPASDGGQFDTIALWAVVGAQVKPGVRVLLVRGSDAGVAQHDSALASDGFSRRLAQAGAEVDVLAVYQRRVPNWDAPALALAQQAASDGSIWLLSSAQGVANLQTLMPGQSWVMARALATHPRIAAAAAAAGFGVVCESRPLLAEMVASIKSMA